MTVNDPISEMLSKEFPCPVCLEGKMKFLSPFPPPRLHCHECGYETIHLNKEMTPEGYKEVLIGKIPYLEKVLAIAKRLRGDDAEYLEKIINSETAPVQVEIDKEGGTGSDG